MEKEIYKDIPNYEGVYQVSNLGNVKSLPREVFRDTSNLQIKERILKGGLSGNGYITVVLRKDAKPKTFTIHKLVAITFLNHKPKGYKEVVDHIDGNRLNNKLNNLRLVTNRENCSVKNRGSSKYTGVSWVKRPKKWQATIYINGKNKNLGHFDCETKAHLEYQRVLNTL